MDGFEEGSSGYSNQTWFIVREDYYYEKVNATEFKNFVIDINQNISPEIINSKVSWIRYMDYTYSFISNSGSAMINTFADSCMITGLEGGIATVRATHKLTGITKYFNVKVNMPHVTYLKNVYGFNNDTTDKLEQLYNRLGQKHSDDNDLMLSWRYTRLLSSFVYSGDLWDETAGEALKNTGYSDVDLYFVEFLDFDKEEYDDLKKLIINLHKENKNNLLVIGDFAHMMYSLSARLAYYLNVDGLVADIAGVFVGEDISYLAGWLGEIGRAHV